MVGIIKIHKKKENIAEQNIRTNNKIASDISEMYKMINNTIINLILIMVNIFERKVLYIKI